LLEALDKRLVDVLDTLMDKFANSEKPVDDGNLVERMERRSHVFPFICVLHQTELRKQVRGIISNIVDRLQPAAVLFVFGDFGVLGFRAIRV